MKAIKSTKKLGKKVPNTRFGFFTRALEAIKTAAVNKLAVRRRRSRKKKPEQKAVSLNEKFIREAIKSTKTAVNKLAVRRRRPRKKNAVFTFDKLTKPKRTSSGYFVFMEEFRKTCKEEFPENISTPVVNKAGSWRWKSLSDAEKAPYVAKGEERKTEYTKNLQDYNDKITKKEDDDIEEAGLTEIEKDFWNYVAVIGVDRLDEADELMREDEPDNLVEEEYGLVKEKRKFARKGSSVSTGSDYNNRPGRNRDEDQEYSSSSSEPKSISSSALKYKYMSVTPEQRALELVDVQPVFASVKTLKELTDLAYIPEFVFVNTVEARQIARITRYVKKYRQKNVYSRSPVVEKKEYKLIRCTEELTLDIGTGIAYNTHYYIPTDVKDYKDLLGRLKENFIDYTAHPCCFELHKFEL